MVKGFSGLSRILCMTIAITLSSAALAADERTQDAVDARQGLLKVVRSYFGPIFVMVRGDIPYNAEVVEKNASAIAALLPMIPDLFRMDTSDTDVETGALDTIWDNWEDFAGKAEASAERARALAAAASDEDAAKAAFRAFGGSCSACHDDYREQD